MSRLSVLALLVAVLACLSLPTPAVARIDLSPFFKAVAPVSSEDNVPVVRVTEAPLSPAAVQVAVAGLSISNVYGCYYEGYQSGRLLCGLGQVIVLQGSGFTSAASVTIDNGRFACTDVTLNSSSVLSCTLPTSVPADRLGLQLTVNITDGSTVPQGFAGGGIVLSAEPILPTITSIKGCGGGVGGNPVTSCRQNSRLTFIGAGLYMSRTPAVVRVGSYVCPSNIPRYDNTIDCYLPSVADADINQPLPVSLTIDGRTATYASTVTIWGKLALTSVTGCDSSSGVPSNCSAGDVITMSGSAFNLGPQGDANDLKVTVGGQPCTSFTVLSNNAITCVLPPLKVAMAALVVSVSTVTSDPLAVVYSQLLNVAVTYGGIKGCFTGQAPYPNVPACKAGDTLLILLFSVQRLRSRQFRDAARRRWLRLQLRLAVPQWHCAAVHGAERPLVGPQHAALPAGGRCRRAEPAVLQRRLRPPSLVLVLVQVLVRAEGEAARAERSRKGHVHYRGV